MTFYRGQKVVCIDSSCTWIGMPVDLIKGQTYTIAGFDYETDAAGNYGIIIEGHDWEDSLHALGYRASRFRPVVERKTDISALQALLNPVKRRERA